MTLKQEIQSINRQTEQIRRAHSELKEECRANGGELHGTVANT